MPEGHDEGDHSRDERAQSRKHGETTDDQRNAARDRRFGIFELVVDDRLRDRIQPHAMNSFLGSGHDAFPPAQAISRTYHSEAIEKPSSASICRFGSSR